MDPITIASAAAVVLKAFPMGGGKKKAAATVLRTKEEGLRALAKDCQETAAAGGSLGPGALRMLAVILLDHAGVDDAVADLLTKEDDLPEKR